MSVLEVALRRCVWLVLLCAGCPSETQIRCEDPVQGYLDADGDGFGSALAEPEVVCQLGELADNARDCNDDDPTVFPGAEELCNGLDDDCNGELDNGFELKTFYADDDGDGFGDRFPATLACDKPEGAWVRNDEDCNDADAAVNPDATEVCNGGRDDNCDGLADDNDPDVDPTTRSRFYRDADADGFGTPNTFEELCAARSGLVADNTDCDDGDDDISPAATEVCNHIDDDCDTLIDDGDPSTDPATMTAQFEDLDGDGFGNPGGGVLACWPTPGQSVDNDLDCDDTNLMINPDRTDVCNGGIDDDCDPSTDEDLIDGLDWLVDGDGDGYGAGAAVVTLCDDPGGALVPETPVLDCDDGDPALSPATPEDCSDGDDDNCDLLVDCDDPMCSTFPSCSGPCVDVVLPSTLPINQPGSTVGQGNEMDATCVSTNANDVVFQWLPPGPGSYEIDLQGSTYDTTLWVMDRCNGTILACNDDYFGLQSRVLVNVGVVTGPLIIVVDGYSTAQGAFTLHIN